MWRDDARDGEGVAGRLEDDAVVRHQALGEELEILGLVGTRPAERARPPSAIATSQKSRCTSSPTDLTIGCLLRLDDARTGGGGRERHLRIRTHNRRTRASLKGRPVTPAGSCAQRTISACTTAFSREPPVPEPRVILRRRFPWLQGLRGHSHAGMPRPWTLTARACRGQSASTPSARWADHRSFARSA